MPGGTAQRRVHHGNIDRRRLRAGIFRQQAVGRVFVAETHTVNIDVFVAQLDLAAAPVKNMHIVRQRDLAGDGVFRIMVALDIKDPDARIAQSIHLGCEIGRRLGAAFLSVVKIA